MSYIDEAPRNSKKGIGLEKYPRLSYLTPFAFVMLSFFLLPRYTLFHTDADSARSMLGAIVQSEASIVAIVITLTLVAVQLTASSYSSKVTDIFIRKLDFWALIFLYVSAISFGVAVLKTIEVESKVTFVFDQEQQTIISETIRGNVTSTTEKCVFLSFFLGIFCFSALVPYTYVMFTALKPAKIVEELSEKISKDKTLQETPIRTIMEIVWSFMGEYNYETARDGLNQVIGRICKVFVEEELEEKKNIEILERIFRNLFRLGNLALTREDENFVDEIFEGIVKIGEHMILRDFREENPAIDTLKEIGKAATKKGFMNTARKAIESIFGLGKVAAEKKLGDITGVAVQSICELGVLAIEKELRTVAEVAVQSICELGVLAIEKGLETAAHRAVESLEDLGTAAAHRKNEMIAHQAAESLWKIGKAAVDGKKDMIAREAAESLKEVGKAGIEQGLKIKAEWAVESLRELGKAAAKGGLKEVVDSILEYLQEIEKVAARK